MAYTHQIHFTKNMLDGPMQGSQIQDSFKAPNAHLAAIWAMSLAHDGVHRDMWTGAPYTAHNVRLVAIETELPELVERGWDEYDQADQDYDSMVEASL